MEAHCTQQIDMFASTPDETPVIIEFSDDRDEQNNPKKTEAKFAEIKYFETIKNAIQQGFKNISSATPLRASTCVSYKKSYI